MKEADTDTEEENTFYVGQHETAFLAKDDPNYGGLRTENVGQCLAASTSSDTGISLRHIDTQTSKESITDVFYNLPKGKGTLKIQMRHIYTFSIFYWR